MTFRYKKKKHVSYEKWYKQRKYFVYRVTQKFSNSLRPMEEKFLKLILTYLYYTKYYYISVFHSDVQKHVSYTGSLKHFYVLCCMLRNS